MEGLLLRNCLYAPSWRRQGNPAIPATLVHYALDTVFDLTAPPSPRLDDQEGKSSPHPFVARVPIPCSFLLPLLIALLLFLLLGTAPSPVIALFRIHLPLIGRGLGDLGPARTHSRGRGYRGQGSHYRWE